MALAARHITFARGGEGLRKLPVERVVRFAGACKVALLFRQRDQPAAIGGQHLIEREPGFRHRPRILRVPSAVPRLTFRWRRTQSAATTPDA